VGVCAPGAQWADFAAEHKGTSYKLHVYVGWSVGKSDLGGKDASLSGNSARARHLAAVLLSRATPVPLRSTPPRIVHLKSSAPPQEPCT
jgi:hypothetical protein